MLLQKVPPLPHGDRSPNRQPGTSTTNDLPAFNTTTLAELSLAQVLSLAGAESWAVLLADERVREAQSRYDAARVMWLPSLNAGIGYNKHDGQIQDTGGAVIDVSRNSLFVGGGAVTSGAPTAGGSGGPARLAIDLSLADAIFLPRSTRHLLDAQQAQRFSTFNDTLLQAALAYYDLIQAQQQLALAKSNLALTDDLLKATKAFEASGKGTKADISRVEVEVEKRRRDIIQAQLAVQLASAELARILRIDVEDVPGAVSILAKDEAPLPVDFIPPETPLNDLIAQAVSSRPELSETYSRMEAAHETARAEQWRPWIPSLHVGVSSGVFGGGTGDTLRGLDGRADVDVLAVWQVRNLGLGTKAVRDQAESRYRQRHVEYHRVRDRIVSEVAKSSAGVRAAKTRLTLARSQLEKAADAHRRQLARIRGFQGIPLEALQSVQAVVEARQQLLNATIDYNRAQLKLLRAIGRTAENP